MSEELSVDVILIAGTSDARQILQELIKANLKIAATVTTKFGNILIDEHPNVKVFEKKLTAEGMARLAKHIKAKCLIDASHPYAAQASSNAIKACSSAQITYLRFEREVIKFDGPSIKRVPSFEEAAKLSNTYSGNIFLTIGSNNLKYFTDNVSDFKSRLFARVLPESNILAKCEAIGLCANNIIALKGPFTESFNMEMLKSYNASVMVTKESGISGGTDEKVKAAFKVGIPVILIDRPNIEYSNKFSNIEELVNKVIDLNKVETPNA